MSDGKRGEHSQFAAKIDQIQGSLDVLTEAHGTAQQGWRLFQKKVTDDINTLKEKLNTFDMKQITDLFEKSIQGISNEIQTLKEAQSTELLKLNESINLITKEQADIRDKVSHLEQQASSTVLEEKIVSIRKEAEHATSFAKEQVQKLEDRIGDLELKLVNEERTNTDDMLARLMKLEDRLTQLEDETQEDRTDKDDTEDRKVLQVINKQMMETTKAIANIEDRSRRNNVIVHGIPRKHTNETWEECEQTIQNFFKEKLQLPDIQIERAHRLNTKSDGIIVCVQNFKDKDKILKHGYKLRDTDMVIREDFSKYTRQQRKQLWDFYRDNRAEDDRGKLTYNKLIWRGKTYTTDSLPETLLESLDNEGDEKDPKKRETFLEVNNTRETRSQRGPNGKKTGTSIGRNTQTSGTGSIQAGDIAEERQTGKEREENTEETALSKHMTQTKRKGKQATKSMSEKLQSEEPNKGARPKRKN